MPYVGQFDNLVREQDRGHAIRFTRTIAVFTDGLVVCPVPVPGGSPVLQRGVLSRLLGIGGPGGLGGPGGPGELAGSGGRGALAGERQIGDTAVAMGAGGTAGDFARAWRGAHAIPFAVVERIVLTKPQQVSRLEIVEEVTGDGGTSHSVYLGDLAADRVRELLASLLGERLQIDVVT